ncbi:MAG: type II toxin-antitoxin system RelB/DinJ family antitoxin [Lactobacillus gallinarum]|uniref:type II toxin-antitoxin system RelB/DinJ family antitoxin n=1 Tax=Lactobacillus gallinarum TaxID=52242 RepID=UPI0038183F9C
MILTKNKTKIGSFNYFLQSLRYLNITTAINVFLKKVVATGGIPFELKETPEQKATRDLVQTISKLPHKEAKSTKDIEDWLNED